MTQRLVVAIGGNAARPESIRGTVEWGSAARKALAPGRRGKVIARFERSFYVATGGGLACIGGPGLGRGPLNVLVPDIGKLPDIGERLRCERGSIRFSSGLTFPIQGAVLWRPVPAPAFRRGRLPRIPCIFPAQTNAFVRWIAEGANGRPPDKTASLIGLGGGLTPAGDDFIGGALICLHALGSRALAGRIAKWALKLASTRSNRISLAHLQSASAGEGHEALHQALAATFTGKRSLALEMAALRRIGHSSGMDAFAGAVAVLAHRN